MHTKKNGEHLYFNVFICRKFENSFYEVKLKGCKTVHTKKNGEHLYFNVFMCRKFENSFYIPYIHFASCVYCNVTN